MINSELSKPEKYLTSLGDSGAHGCTITELAFKDEFPPIFKLDQELYILLTGVNYFMLLHYIEYAGLNCGCSIRIFKATAEPRKAVFILYMTCFHSVYNM